MREILFLAHRVPYPPDRGDKMRSWHLLQAAAAIAPVHLVCFAEDDMDRVHAESGPLRAATASRHIFPRERSRFAAAAIAFANGCPISVEAFASRTMAAAVDSILAGRPVDTIFAFSNQMARFVLGKTDRRRFVMDFVDMDSAKFAAYADAARPPMRWLWAREAERLFRWERRIAAAADVSLFVSEAEAAVFRARTHIRPRRVAVLENGIDLAHYDAAAVPPLPPALRGPGPLIVFTGQMDYRPNVEAVIDYVAQVLPVVRAAHPEARFAIVGRNPTRAVHELGKRPGVLVTGAVADPRMWIAAAALVAAPLTIARGVQNKVLEAMALARPVVASPAAFEGIEARPGSEIVLAETVAEQAEGAITILDDPALGVRVGQAARRRMEARYRWIDRLAGFGDLLAGTRQLESA